MKLESCLFFPDNTKKKLIYHSARDLTKKNNSGGSVTQDDFTSVGFTPENESADNQTDSAWAFPHALLLSLCKCTRIRKRIEQKKRMWLFAILGNGGYKLLASASTGFWLLRMIKIECWVFSSQGLVRKKFSLEYSVYKMCAEPKEKQTSLCLNSNCRAKRETEMVPTYPM